MNQSEAFHTPMPMSNARKHDDNKLRMDLIQPEFLIELAKVLTHGAAKYGANNWQGLPDAHNRYYAALLRHLMEWRKGHTIDQDSTLPHLAHAICNLMFLLHEDTTP